MAVKAGTTTSATTNKATTSQGDDTATGDHAQNLRLLKAILDISKNSGTISEQPQRLKTPLVNAGRQNAKPKRNAPTANKNGKRNAVDKEEEQGVEPPTSAVQQKKFAMSCFNQSLKVLCIVARKQQATRIHGPEGNLINDTDHVEGHTQRPIEPKDEEKESTIKHVECACSALTVLRLHDHQEAPSEDASRKREQGAVLLLDKMITLGLHDMAHNEASRIHEQYWKRRKAETAAYTSRKISSTVKLSALISEVGEISRKEDFEMIASFQSQVLRLAILMAPTAIDQGFVRALKIQTKGSPSDVIISAQRNALITIRMAGESLRIVSQAMSKVASATIRPAQTPTFEQDAIAIDLLAEAQVVKLTLWQLQERETDLNLDFWAPIEKGLRLLWNKRPQKDSPRYLLTKSVLERLQNELQTSSRHSSPPAKLDLLLSQLAESNEDSETTLACLEKLLSTATGIDKLSHICRIAATVIQARSEHRATTERIETAIDLLNNVENDNTILNADCLLSVVRLRKAGFERLSTPTSEESNEALQLMQALYLRVLSAILRFCHSFRSKRELDDKLRRSARLAMLKTVESVLDVEMYATSTHPVIYFEYLKVMKDCDTIVSGLLNAQIGMLESDSGTSVVHAIKVRISNVFWRAHLHPSLAQTSDFTAIQLAEISVISLNSLSSTELSKAALGPRLEKLSDLYVQAGDLAAARAHIKRAIKHYTLSGALADAVEASLSKRSAETWKDTASLASQLGRALHSYNSMSTADVKDDLLLDYIYDDDSVPPIHQAILLEHQTLYFLRKPTDISAYRSLLESIRKVVKLTDTLQYRVWALRFISTVVFRASKVVDLSIEDTSLLEQFISIILRNDTDDTSLFLRPYHNAIEVQIKLQRGLLTPSLDQDNLRDDLKRLLTKVESCSNTEELNAVVNDLDMFRSILQAYIDQASALHDYEAAILCLKIRICLEGHNIRPGIPALGDCYIQLALGQMRIDDIKSAGLSLAQADKLLKAETHDPEQTVRFLLASAEHQLASSALDKCRSSLIEAGSAFATSWPQETSPSGTKQIERDSVVAKGALLASRLALRQGDSLLANQYARQATKISVSIWSTLEKRILDSMTVAKNDSTLTSLTNNISSLSIEPEKRLVTPRIVGARYWPYLDMYVRSIKQLAFVLSHSGLCEDALHYFKQLKNLTQSVLSSRVMLDPTPALSLLLAKAGKVGEATQMINDSATLVCEGGSSQHGHTDQLLAYCEAYIMQGNILKAQALVPRICVLTDNNNVEQLESKSGKSTTKSVSKARRGISRPEAIKVPPKRQRGLAKAPKKQVSPAAVQSQTPPTSFLSFDQISNESRRKAVVLVCRQQSEVGNDAAQNDRDIVSKFVQPPSLVQELYEEAKCMLSRALEQLSADALASVLTESAVALPSRIQSTHRKARISFLQGGEDNDAVTSFRGATPSDAGFAGFGTIAQSLQSALEICSLLLKDRQQYCPTDMIHSLVNMEARISLLLTSMSLPFAVSSTDLVLKASQPKDHALERERIVSLAEQATQDRKSLSLWPERLSNTYTSAVLPTTKRLGELPASWSIISLALAENKDELLLSKTVGGTDPFLVRIPLRRSNDGEGSDEFVFEDAKTEMEDIIEAANSSSHDIRGTLDKATRTQWHADREALDQRLESLLGNVETIWLGGFRGVLSPFGFEKRHVKQFGQSLTQSLDKNLPSRQKSSTVEERVQIHEHILEIFIGLGNPNEDDLDDPVMDLLYFVVDILQFNGERNAYDEIDWDLILIDVLDALKVYHNTIESQKPNHTILIIDKELEMFPWEALPCLIDHPVSRMPSLGSIFDRLTQIRAQSPSRTPSTYKIKKSSVGGAYVLNPGGDLTSTQTLFEPILSDNLPSTNYTSLINTPPTEPQFSSLLSTSDILLYIGHGSGAQYIRPRTIRALPSCPVTFLFGCSSAKMTTHGLFESTGMPRAYMLGHAPAVVGCLWDVTDKEIDRVALRCLVSWGLVDGADGRVVEGLKRREKKRVGKGGDGRRKRSGDERGEGRKTLVEAVRDGREACVLRYLCGAAVVVYGVPVSLE